MTSISQSNRYLPHKLNTKYYAVKLYRTGTSVHLYAEDIKFLNHLNETGIKNLMAQRNH